MTGPENARLGKLEVEVSYVKADVAEIKSDVKALIATQEKLAIALAVKDAVETATQKSRSQTGVWVRFFSERAIAVGAALIALAALISR